MGYVSLPEGKCNEKIPYGNTGVPRAASASNAMEWELSDH